MKIFWLFAKLIVRILIPEKIMNKIDTLPKPLRVSLKTFHFILILAAEVALVYVFLYLPLKALGLGFIHIK